MLGRVRGCPGWQLSQIVTKMAGAAGLPGGGSAAPEPGRHGLVTNRDRADQGEQASATETARAPRRPSNPTSERGAFVRKPVALNERITSDGSSPWPVESGSTGWSPPGPARGRTAVIVRRLLGLSRSSHSASPPAARQAQLALPPGSGQTATRCSHPSTSARRTARPTPTSRPASPASGGRRAQRQGATNGFAQLTLDCRPVAGVPPRGCAGPLPRGAARGDR